MQNKLHQQVSILWLSSLLIYVLRISTNFTSAKVTIATKAIFNNPDVMPDFQYLSYCLIFFHFEFNMSIHFGMGNANIIPSQTQKHQKPIKQQVKIKK